MNEKHFDKYRFYNGKDKQCIKDLCRICAFVGSYDIHGIIPMYTHAEPREYLLWQKPISVLLTEVTGCKIEETDELPQKICLVCISYLKHSVTFRNKYLHTIENLSTAKTLIKEENVSKNNNKDSLSLVIKNKIKTSIPTSNNNVNTAIGINSKNTNNEMNNNINRKCLDLFMEDGNRIFNNCDDDNDYILYANNDLELPIVDNDIKNAIYTFFHYNKSHTENYDDDDDDDSGGGAKSIEAQSKINIDDQQKLKERKCSTCNYIFLTHANFENHMKECMLKKLTDFTEHLNQNLIQLKHAVITQTEYIGSIVFAIKNIVKNLSLNYVEFLNGSTITCSNTKTTIPIIKKKEIIERTTISDLSTNDKIFSENYIFKGDINNINNNMRKNNKLNNSNNTDSIKESSKFQSLNHKMNESYSPNKKVPFNLIVARCSLCVKPFISIVDFELHNRLYHNHIK